MSKIKNVLLSNRFKSFYWRLSMMLVAIIAGELAINIDMFSPYISAELVIVLGLLFGEISKGINNYLSGKKA